MKNIGIISLFFILNSLTAQVSPTNNSHVSPLKIPFSFSGNFGELRPSHFHSGLDFRTQGKTGIPVYAVKEGFVSRLSVSPRGYGNAIYLTHPDGTTTVYGHLDRFIPRIHEYVRDKQYYTENYQINVSLFPGEIDIKKGELIAWSGNTGSSGGPHLHFEVRNTKSERAENPLFYIPGIRDNSAPVITGLYLYPLTENSHVNKSASKKQIAVVKTSTGYVPATDSPIEVYGKIGIGIQAIDDYSGVGIKCGIYSASLIYNGETIFGFKMNNLSFDQTRYANSQMDFEENKINQRKVQRLYLQPGNKLDIYGPVVNSGVLDLEDGGTHSVQVIVSDAFENKASLKFKVTSKAHQLSASERPSTSFFAYNQSNRFKNEEVKVVIPDGALYESIYFHHGTRPKINGCFSKIHTIHKATVPLQKSITLSINAEEIPNHLTSKSLIVSIDKNGNKSSVGGEYSLGWVTAAVNEFGNYAVTVDTIAPIITPLTIKEKKKLTNDKQIQFKITDNLSGIKSFRGEIDEHWVLFEYHPKTRIISYTFDKKRMEFGKNHQLSLVVIDSKDNRSEYKATFYK